MFSDDVYRKELSETVSALQDWARAYADCAEITAVETPAYWKLAAMPNAGGACPFELVLRADQRFDLQIAGETYEDKPVDTFGFFPMVLRAIAAGNVERISVRSALTSALEAIETRITLEDGWAWIGERRIAARGARRAETPVEMKCHRFLPYRR